MSAYAKVAAIAAIALFAAAPSAFAAAADGHTVTSPRDASSGMPTGKRMHKPITVYHEIGRTSATATATDSGDAASGSPADSSAAAMAAGAPLKGVDVKLGK